MNEEKIKKSVYEFYDQIAKENKKVDGDINKLNQSLGYSEKDLEDIPKEAQLGLGCGNPLKFGRPQINEYIGDLGSGKGMDVFLASKSIDRSGLVIGIDSNYKMVEKARHIASKRGFHNTDFRLGEIEHLPVANDHLDLLISNCVINLSTDKKQVYSEIYRVLKPGGRISISDILLKKDLSDEMKNHPNIYGT